MPATISIEGKSVGRSRPLFLERRVKSVTVRLTGYEYDWLRRKAYWEGANMAEILRRQLHAMVRDEGYLRPPDDEPQDFGYEKEMIEFVNSLGGEPPES